MPFITPLPPNTSVIIAGMGGFGQEVAGYLMEEATQSGFTIKGGLADHIDQATIDAIGIPHLGTITDYRPAEGEVVVVAVGSVEGRKSILQRLWSHNVPTPSYIHGSCFLARTAHIERGVVISPFSVVNQHAHIKEGAMVNVHCTVAHGVTVGAFSILCPYVALNGDASAGDECFLSTRATIYPRTSIGNGCVVDAHTGVRISAQDNQMITSRGKYQVLPLRKPRT